MTFAVVSNIATMILCIAVLIQTLRLMRALDTVKSGVLTDVVTALDNSTSEARRVLGRLTELLRGDVAVTARTLGEGRAMIEELTVMTGIANAIAERIVDAAGASNKSARALVAGRLPASSLKVALPKSTEPRISGPNGTESKNSEPKETPKETGPKNIESKATGLASIGEAGLSVPAIGPAAPVPAPRRKKPAPAAKVGA